MHFTQEDYIKIENWLHRNSVKDTEFQEALPFTGKEIVTIVQNGHNRKVNIQEFINQLYKHGVEDFLNVTNTYRANNITLKEAIRLIPEGARKEGQVITFLNTDGNWEIYQFIGELNQWDNPTLWNNPFDWEKLVVNSILPDEEDLTKSLPDENGNSYLSLKDRKYEQDKYSGLGRKILRRRVVEIEDPIYGTQEKNLLLQADFNEENTIYEIRYDFDLNGAEITVPESCVLDFKGGSFSNGVITGHNTIIKARQSYVFNNVEILGTFNIPTVYSYWFKHDYNLPCDTIFRSLIVLGQNGVIVLEKNTYHLSTEILMNNVNVRIEGNDALIVKDNDNARLKLVNNDEFDFEITHLNFDGLRYKKHLFALLNFKNIHISHCTFKNMGDVNDTDNYIADGFYVENVERAVVSRCIIDNCKRDGIYFGCAKYLTVEHCYISNCQRFGIVNDGSQGNRVIVEADYNNNVIENCDGGLHCENKFLDGYEGTLNVYNNTITNCGKTGSPSFGGIVSGNLLHANIHDNVIKDFDIEHLSMRAIQFSNPLSVNVYNNKLDNVPYGIVFNRDQYKPSSVVFSGNNIKSNLLAISMYMAGTDNTTITSNDISVKAGSGISINLTSRVLITNNNIRSLVEDGTALRAINSINTPSAVIKNNTVYGTFAQDLALWTDKIDGDAAYGYTRNYSIVNNNFRNNNLFSIPFDVENGNIIFYIKNSEALVENIDGFYYTSGDCCITKSLQYTYNINRGWIPVTKIETVEYKDLVFSESKNLIYFVKDLPNGRGGTGMYLISTGNYGFKDIYGQLYTNELKPKYIGTHNEKPLSANQGFNYFDTDSRRPLWKDGVYGDSLYRDAMGNLSTDKFSGTFAEKPGLPSVGFAYFCTDKSTEEGGQNGIMIYHKGNRVWVDALGREITE